jgi:4-hydroxysphinganine ceramide fatty acyl 2-hydroxylase
MERLSYTSWQVIPLIWVPVALYLWKDFVTGPESSGPLGLAIGIAILFSGIMIWTLLEYIIHRFIFHADENIPDHPLSLQLHFLLHGVHHKVPMDRERLVMPPALLAILSACVHLVAGSFMFVLPPAIYKALFGSGFLGYVCYDMIHYSEHHSEPSSFLMTGPVIGAYFRDLKRIHMKHHWNDLYHYGYGITSKLWDYVFGTVLTDDLWKKRKVQNTE